MYILTPTSEGRPHSLPLLPEKPQCKVQGHPAQFVSSPDTRSLAEAHRHLQTACSHSRYQIPERRAGTQSHQLLKSTLQHRHKCCSFPPSMDNPIFNRASCVGTHLSVAESNQGGLTLTEFWIHLCDSPARSQPEQ